MKEQFELPLEPLPLPQQTHVRLNNHFQFDPKDFLGAVKQHDWHTFEQWFPIVQSRKYSSHYFTSALNIACERNHTDMIVRLAPLANCNALHGQPLLNCIRHNNIVALEIVLPLTHFSKLQSKALSTCILPQFLGSALDYLLPYCKAENDDGVALFAALSHNNIDVARKLYPVSNVKRVWDKIYSPNFGPGNEYRDAYIEDLQLLEREHLHNAICISTSAAPTSLRGRKI